MSGTVRNCRAISSGSVGKCLQCVWNRPEISGNISQHFPDEVLFKVPDKVIAEIHEGEIFPTFSRRRAFQGFQTQGALFSWFPKKKYGREIASVSRQVPENLGTSVMYSDGLHAK